MSSSDIEDITDTLSVNENDDEDQDSIVLNEQNNAEDDDELQSVSEPEDSDNEDASVASDNESIVDDDVDNNSQGTESEIAPQDIENDDDVSATSSALESEDNDDEDEYGKFDTEDQENYFNTYHSHLKQHNTDEIDAMTRIVRNDNGVIIDEFHQTIPILTKYEKARILGQRAKQIDACAEPLVELPVPILDGYLIAREELKQKKVPFIIRRPLPNGGSEYWKVRDLEYLDE